MRNINYIVLHCTATSQSATKESIIAYWKQELRWKNPGYHYLIDKDGTIHSLLPIEQVANGVKGYNRECIHIAYIGGIDENGKAIDNRTKRQILSQLQLIVELSELFPDARILGHRDFPSVTKACPSFDVGAWLEGVGF